MKITLTKETDDRGKVFYYVRKDSRMVDNFTENNFEEANDLFQKIKNGLVKESIEIIEEYDTEKDQ